MALNFPDPSASPWIGDNGVMYTWVEVAGGEGYWSGSSENLEEGLPTLFVEKAGDSMSGDLTVGTDKIKLEASTGKITATSTTDADANNTVVTKDYLVSSAHWEETSGSLQPVDTNNKVIVGGDKITLNTDGSAAYSAKITSANTVAGDSSSTLTTKGYVDNSVSAVPTAGDGTITIVQPGTSNQTFTVNQSGNKTITLKNDNTQNPPVVPGDGTITIVQPGTSNQTFTVNQSGNKTITLKNDNTQNTPGNGQINVNAGTGLSVTGSNATADQSGNTTRTLSLNTTYTDDRYVNSTGESVLSGNGEDIVGVDNSGTIKSFSTANLASKEKPEEGDYLILEGANGVKYKILASNVMPNTQGDPNYDWDKIAEEYVVYPALRSVKEPAIAFGTSYYNAWADGGAKVVPNVATRDQKDYYKNSNSGNLLSGYIIYPIGRNGLSGDSQSRAKTMTMYDGNTYGWADNTGAIFYLNGADAPMTPAAESAYNLGLSKFTQSPASYMSVNVKKLRGTFARFDCNVIFTSLESIDDSVECDFTMQTGETWDKKLFINFVTLQGNADTVSKVVLGVSKHQTQAFRLDNQSPGQPVYGLEINGSSVSESQLTAEAQAHLNKLRSLNWSILINSTRAISYQALAAHWANLNEDSVINAASIQNVKDYYDALTSQEQINVRSHMEEFSNAMPYEDEAAVIAVIDAVKSEVLPETWT